MLRPPAGVEMRVSTGKRRDLGALVDQSVTAVLRGS